jgi:hypothetical protein
VEGEPAHCIGKGEIHLLVAQSERILGQRELFRCRRQPDEPLGDDQRALVHRRERIAHADRQTGAGATGLTRCTIDADRHGSEQGQQGDDDDGIFR